MIAVVDVKRCSVYEFDFDKIRFSLKRFQVISSERNVAILHALTHGVGVKQYNVKGLTLRTTYVRVI